MRTGLLAQLSAALVFCACGLAGGRGLEDDPPPEPILTLYVDNNNFYDATLYALSQGGERRRLGIVAGNNRATFTFRWLHPELRVIIQLLAVGATATETMMVIPGDSLHLIIQPDLHHKIPGAAGAGEAAADASTSRVFRAAAGS